MIVVMILKRSGQDMIVCSAVFFRSLDKGTLGKGRAVSVAIVGG